jgi:hypothetical protein
MLFALKDIKANPFRRIERYPLRRDRIDALRGSRRATGYRGNVVGRRCDGGAEIAYGYHRLAALREARAKAEKCVARVRKARESGKLSAEFLTQAGFQEIVDA